VSMIVFFFFQAEDGIRDFHVTGVQTCALPISDIMNPGDYDPSSLIAQATAAREAGADLVVATIHWGVEYQLAPNVEQEAMAQALAESGQIDLVVGTHPHVPQPYALLDGGPDGSGMWVAWSLGNFISNQDSN